MRGDYHPSTAGSPDAFPILKSKSADMHLTIESTPDEHWEWAETGEPPIAHKSGHLLITAGQNTGAARITALASEGAYVGNSWMPVTGLEPNSAKAAAVFLNSTVGRLLLMRSPGRALSFPVYSANAANALPIPDLSDQHICSVLAGCWEATRCEVVPQFRDGYTPIRRRWDDAVCAALGWDIDEMTELGELLAREPRVRAVAYGQWKA